MYVLTPLFGNYYQSKIIEVFLENNDEELSIPEIIEIAETSRGSTYKYLDYLVKEKIIKKIRKIGKTQLYRLNLRHPTTKILLLLEHERFTENIERLIGKLPLIEEEYHQEPIITITERDGKIKKQFEDGSVEMIHGGSSTKWNIKELKRRNVNYNI